jgi:putative ABC transport system substrate-binding protein
MTSVIDRRTFLAGAAGLIAAPLAAEAQYKKVPVVGFLGANTPAAAGHLTSAFVGRLRDLGWVEGRNVAIEYRWAAGQTVKFGDLAAELVAAGADVIVTSGDAPALSARRVTSSVPIVMASSANILATGLVKTLAHPGGNVTGLTFSVTDTTEKRLGLLKEAVPGLKRVGVLFNPDAAAGEVPTLREVAPSLRLALDFFEFRTVGDVDRIAKHPERSAIGALFVQSDPLVFTNRIAINAFATRERLPTVHRLQEYVNDGGLLSYGPDFRVMFRRAADYVDKILKGAKPENLPVEQPTKFELVINLKTAKALGLTIPRSLLQRADQVIE